MTWAAPQSPWSDDEKALLRELWADDNLSAAVIAQRIGRARSGIIGQAHRLGLKNRGNPIKSGPGLSQTKDAIWSREKRKRKGAPKPKPAAPAKARPAQPKPPQKRAQVAAGERAVVARTAYPAPAGFRGRTCQWIPGEPSADDACKCGGPALPERPYCSRHEAIAVVSASERAQALRALKAAA